MRHSNSDGFTLVEVLATVLILGLAVILVTGAVIPATRNGDRREERLSAEREARSTLEQVLGLDFDDLVPGTLGPAAISGYPDATRTVTVAAWSAQVGRSIGVHVGDEVDLTVSRVKGPDMRAAPLRQPVGIDARQLLVPRDSAW
jgi:prepilin-type N-terminal cleavage/methylation domain-containing protein